MFVIIYLFVYFFVSSFIKISKTTGAVIYFNFLSQCTATPTLLPNNHFVGAAWLCPSNPAEYVAVPLARRASNLGAVPLPGLAPRRAATGARMLDETIPHSHPHIQKIGGPFRRKRALRRFPHEVVLHLQPLPKPPHFHGQRRLAPPLRHIHHPGQLRHDPFYVMLDCGGDPRLESLAVHILGVFVHGVSLRRMDHGPRDGDHAVSTVEQSRYPVPKVLAAPAHEIPTICALCCGPEQFVANGSFTHVHAGRADSLRRAVVMLVALDGTGAAAAPGGDGGSGQLHYRGDAGGARQRRSG